MTVRSIAKVLLGLGAILASANAFSQANPGGTPGKTLKLDTIYDIRSKLVELAMAGPLLEMVGRGEIRAANELSKTKSAVLNNVILSGNLNEFTINGSPSNYANLYPRYNIGVLFPIGTFITRDKDIKIARQNLGMAQADKARVFAEVKAIVLKLYEDYEMYDALFQNQNKLTDDVYLNFLKAETDFEAGEINEVEFTRASREYNEELAKKLNYQRSRQQAKIDIEQYIMVPLEEVIGGKK
ncbi:MAG TPA: TolC family protein [Phnomibacter sp.]|nr:TolC family protein [Phnomibacter sp.]